MIMVILGLLFVVIGCVYANRRLSTKSSDYRFGWPAIWRLACIIGALRISALWVGLAGLRRSDWWQVPANFILMLGLPDIYIVRAARAEPLLWAVLGSLTLAATSFVWSSSLLWVANRTRRKEVARRQES